MRKVYTAKEMQAFLASGRSETDLPHDVILTPTARDVLRERARLGRRDEAPTPAPLRPGAGAPAPSVPDYEFHWTAGADPRTPQEIARFFASAPIRALKERMVDMGRRIWSKNYVDGNGGNLTIRVGDNLVLCTPTLISKGFMTPEDICLVDMEGNQLAGTRKRTSEVNTHIGIMKRQPKAKACCHAHPPHATAFAVAGIAPPSCMIPEAEVFLGKIGIAHYETPGSPECARVVGEIGVDHQAVLMQNHGAITWGKDIEDAYWKLENVDSYCLTIWIASQIGSGVKTIQPEKVKELIEIRKALGMEDARAEWKECELCDNPDFRPGSVCPVSAAPGGGAPVGELHPEAEAAVRAITDQILATMK
jgi:L-fuculose-phosphate aldolase